MPLPWARMNTEPQAHSPSYVMMTDSSTSQSILEDKLCPARGCTAHSLQRRITGESFTPRSLLPGPFGEAFPKEEWSEPPTCPQSEPRLWPSHVRLVCKLGLHGDLRVLLRWIIFGYKALKAKTFRSSGVFGLQGLIKPVCIVKFNTFGM